MYNKNLKLTSVRLDPDMLKELDKFVENRGYWTKNACINRILCAVFANFSESDIYDMVRYSDFTRNPVTAIFKINQLPKLNEV